jgi:hypothetical protein
MLDMRLWSALDPEYFAALQNYYSTWTISRKDAVLPRGVMEFIITGILLTQGKLHGARELVLGGLEIGIDQVILTVELVADRPCAEQVTWPPSDICLQGNRRRSAS